MSCRSSTRHRDRRTPFVNVGRNLSQRFFLESSLGALYRLFIGDAIENDTINRYFDGSAAPRVWTGPVFDTV
jgi:hypothetical protein